jgi:predicted ATPase
MRGEYVTREAAEDYIKLRQAQGVKEPWKEPSFQQRILELSLQRESRVPRTIERVFHDRSVIDGLAYEPENTPTYWNIFRQASQRGNHPDRLNRYAGVFLMELMDTVETTVTRREGLAEGQRLESAFLDIYRGLGYSVTRVPATTVEDRVEFILSRLQ